MDLNGISEKEKIKLIKRSERNSLIKFITGTVVLGLVAHFINLTIQQKNIDLQEKEAEVEYLDKFVTKYLDAGFEKQLEFVDFVRHASNFKETRDRYDILYDHIKNNISELKNENNKYELKIDTLIKELESSKELIALKDEMNKLEKIQSQIENSKSDSEIEKLKNEKMKIEAKNEELLRKQENLIESIKINKEKILTNNKELKRPPIVEPQLKDEKIQIDEVLLFSKSSWAKEGYFRNHNNIKVSIIDLNKRDKTVIFKVEDLTLKQKLGNFTLKIGEKEKLYTKTRKYQLQLKDIGNEGKNILKKAAFYEIKVWEI